MISDGAVVSLSLADSLKSLSLVVAHGYLCAIHVAVGRGYQTEILLADALAAGGKLGDSTHRSSLRGLTAGVGVNLRVDNEHVDILAAGENVVQTAEADVVRSTVTGYDPVRTLHDIVLQIENGLADVAAACLAQRYQLVGDGTGCHSVVGRVKPLLCQLMDLLAARRAFCCGLHRLGQATAELLVGDKHAEAKLCEVLEERVAPCRTVPLLVDSIRSRRHRARVDRRATR